MLLTIIIFVIVLAWLAFTGWLIMRKP